MHDGMGQCTASRRVVVCFVRLPYITHIRDQQTHVYTHPITHDVRRDVHLIEPSSRSCLCVLGIALAHSAAQEREEETTTQNNTFTLARLVAQSQMPGSASAIISLYTRVDRRQISALRSVRRSIAHLTYGRESIIIITERHIRQRFAPAFRPSVAEPRREGRAGQHFCGQPHEH